MPTKEKPAPVRHLLSLLFNKKNRFRSGIILVATLSFLCLTVAESAHHHKNQEAQLLCPVNHIIGHGQLAIPTPAAFPAPPTAPGYFVKIIHRDAIELPRAPLLRPRTRAPPTLVS